MPTLLKVIFLLLPICVKGGELYQIHRMSEPELMQTYTSLLVDACHHADRFWKSSSTAAGAGFWGDGVSDGNQGIRAVAEMVLTCGTLLRYSDALAPGERQEYLLKATGAIRYAAATHITGTQQCPDGKHWGGSWQSAMWTGTLGFGAWLLWDQLDPQVRSDIERVIASEADRFLNSRPPSGLWGDTKAEENGWNLICIAIAVNMFPHHPHAAAWQDKAIEYMMNTFPRRKTCRMKHRWMGAPFATGSRARIFNPISRWRIITSFTPVMWRAVPIF
jgi:hypothetical protein